MIHKFISNDNKGNVNVFEVGSTYTKLGKVKDPVDPQDVASKAYVDSHSSGGLVCEVIYDESEGKYSLDHTLGEILEAAPFVAMVTQEDANVDENSFTEEIVGIYVGAVITHEPVKYYTINFFTGSNGNLLYFEAESLDEFPCFYVDSPEEPSDPDVVK